MPARCLSFRHGAAYEALHIISRVGLRSRSKALRSLSMSFVLSKNSIAIYLFWLPRKCNRVQNHQACLSVMPKYRANESRAKLVCAMPNAADIQRS